MAPHEQGPGGPRPPRHLRGTSLPLRNGHTADPGPAARGRVRQSSPYRVVAEDAGPARRERLPGTPGLYWIFQRSEDRRLARTRLPEGRSPEEGEAAAHLLFD